MKEDKPAYRPAAPVPVVESERIFVSMVCDKCGSGIATNELSHRTRKCSCIGCGGTLRYRTSDEWAELTAEIDRLKAAVEHYEDEYRWACTHAPDQSHTCNFSDETSLICIKDWYQEDSNGYQVAQEALGGAE